MGGMVRAYVVTFANPDESARWVNGSTIDRAWIAGQLAQEARAAGAEEIVLRAHDGTELWRWAHGQSVDDDVESIEKYLVRHLDSGTGEHPVDEDYYQAHRPVGDDD